MTAEQTAMKMSARIMIRFRSQRSMNTPVNGPRRSWGRNVAIKEKARISAEPVSMLSQKMTA